MNETARPLAETGGVVLRGRLWPGGCHDPAEPYEDGLVVVEPDGSVGYAGPVDGPAAPAVPDDRPLVRVAGGWIGPGVSDAHVHLAFGSPGQLLAGGVVAVRDLGAPVARAARWASESAEAPLVTYAGEILTAPGGYPSRSWGADGFAAFVADPEDAASAVTRLSAAGARVVKLAFEPRGGPVLDAAAAAAAVAAAHARGMPVVAHALTAATVEAALAAGVDELAHAPTEALPAEIVERVAAAGIAVTGTLWTSTAEGAGAGVLATARALVEAGAVLRYGTDLGNTATRTGVEPREIALLAETGLGRAGALRAAVAGWWGGVGMVAAGRRAALVVLAGDPLRDLSAWRRVVAVVAGGRLLAGPVPPPDGPGT